METPPVWGVFVASYQMMIIFLLPVILMSSSYYRVIKALWRSTKNMTVLTNTRPFSMEQAEEEEVPRIYFLKHLKFLFRFPNPRGPELAQSTS